MIELINDGFVDRWITLVLRLVPKGSSFSTWIQFYLVGLRTTSQEMDVSVRGMRIVISLIVVLDVEISAVLVTTQSQITTFRYIHVCVLVYIVMAITITSLYTLLSFVQIVCEKLFVGWTMSGTVVVPGLLMSPRTSSSLSALLRLCSNPDSETNDLARSPASDHTRKRLYTVLSEMYSSLNLLG